MKTIKYIELFAGIGGFRYGLEQANLQSNRKQQENTKIKKGKNSVKSKSIKSKQSKKRRNYTCIWANEIDKYACQIYKKNFGNKELCEDDIRKISTKHIPNFDLLTAGFPCQSFSIAGKRQGFEDARGTLFFEICRILKDKKPKYILLENVKGLLNHEDGKTFQTILKLLSDIGYILQWQVLNSKNFGVPQNRERVFIIGYLGGKGIKQIFPIGKTTNSSIKVCARGKHQQDIVYNPEGILNLPAGTHGSAPHLTKICAITRNRSNQPYKKSDISPAVRTSDKAKVRAVLTPDRKNKRQHGRKFKEHNEPMFTLTKQDIHGVIIDKKGNKKNRQVGIKLRTNTIQGYEIAKEGDGIRIGFEKSETARSRKMNGKSHTLQTCGQEGVMIGTNIRRLTPIECERLQGFPDNWTKGISDTQRYKCLGNAVTTNVITEIGKKLLLSL